MEDMWNVVLLVAVPVSEAECREVDELHAELVAVSRDVRGARKVLLWWGETPAEKIRTIRMHDRRRETDVSGSPACRPR